MVGPIDQQTKHVSPEKEKKMITSAQGMFKKVVAARFSPGEDLLLGMEQLCEEHGIRSGVILSGIGSFRVAKFCDIQKIPGSPTGIGYGEPYVKELVELVTISGSICRDEQDKVQIHTHCAFSDKEGHTFGGHLVEGSKVLITADIVIAEMEGLSLERYFDDEIGFKLVRPVQK